MTGKGLVLCALICATLLPQTSARRRFHGSRRQRRAALDIRFMDIARRAFASLATDKGVKQNNKFHRAIDEIEKALASIKARKGGLAFDEAEGKEFMTLIQRTANSGNIESFRQALGRAMFHNMTRIRKASQQTTRETAGMVTDEAKALLDGAKVFLSDIKQQIGEDHFEELISINGEVTLVFVIDATGSMRGDIEAAKAIANEIISHEREVPVSFLLSTFRDPDVAPIVYHDENSVSKAISSIGNITVDGGGDCPEMAFEGLLQALYYTPMPGSALYVFTNAYAKDDSRENIETVIALAIDLGITVYFFTSGDCGGHTSRMASFRRVAQATGGLMFPLHSAEEIKKLSKFVKQNLEGGATIDSNTVNETHTTTYNIFVDDTIRTLVLTVVMSKMGINVRFLSPDGAEQNVTNQLDLNVIFNVEKPTPGNWTLEVPSSAGDIEYLVRTIRKLNIDFSHYYFKYLPKKSSRDHIPVTHPLLGQEAMVMITIYEMQHVDNTSLRFNVVYKNGTSGGTFKLHPVGNSGFRYRAMIKVHKGPYKLQLVGKTKLGHTFTRLAQAYDEAKPFRLRLVYARRYTLPIGKPTKLLLVIDNPGIETYEFDVNDSFGYAMDVVARGHRRLNRRRRNFELLFHVPFNATAYINKTNRVVIKAISNKSGMVSTLITHLLVTQANQD